MNKCAICGCELRSLGIWRVASYEFCYEHGNIVEVEVNTFIKKFIPQYKEYEREALRNPPLNDK